MQLQESFVHRVRQHFKGKGEQWLKQLPELISYTEYHWQLSIKEPFSLSFNFVAPALTKEGKEVVIKLSIPGKEFIHELEVLTLFNGKKTVRLIDFDTEKGILILERISPGNSLAEIKNEKEACKIAAEIIKQIHKQDLFSTNLPSTQSREENLRTIAKPFPNGIGPLSRHTIKEALQIFSYLHQTSQKQYLLHGDFHHFNILASGENEWKMIDPKGLIGELEYDLIQFLLNQVPKEEAYEVTKKRINIFINELPLDRQRLFLWGFCHAVLATAWSVSETQAFNHSFYQQIGVFKQLYIDYYGDADFFNT